MKREEIGLSQEELADGIISSASLSRIESGTRIPRKENLQAILQRLGYSDAVAGHVFEKEDLRAFLMKYELRQAYILNDFGRTEQLLKEYKSLYADLNPIDRQIYETIDTLLSLHNKETSNIDALNRLESALRLTCPKYTRDNLPKFLTFEEILILNNVALRLHYEGCTDKTIAIFYHIKGFYDSHLCDVEEAMRTQPMVLCNLAKYLGIAGRYDECIEVCNCGIRLARETGKCNYLASTLYNLACALNERNMPGDKEASLHNAKLAYYFACVMENNSCKKRYADFIQEKFNITM